MRFFADYFLFANEFLGKLPNIPFDNPISLANKIIYQIDYNIERSPVYISNYIAIIEKYYHDFLDKEFATVYSNVYNDFFCLWKNIDTDNKKAAFLKKNMHFIEFLRTLEQELEKRLFDCILLWLHNYMICKHTLSRHKTDIVFATNILVSIFRLKGIPEKIVSKYIDRILSKDIYDFPFPISIIKQVDIDEFTYKQRRETFLENRSFNEQFDGLRNLLLAPKYRKGYFVYVIDNCSVGVDIRSDFNVKFDTVTFVTPRSKIWEKVSKSILANDNASSSEKIEVYPVFFSENKLLAYVELPYEKKDDTRFEGLRIVNSEITLLNNYLNLNLSVNSDHYLFVEDFDKDQWRSQVGFIGKKNLIQKFDYEELMHNPYELLRDLNTEVSKQILRNEKVFSKAWKDTDLTYFWLYIENTFWYKNLEAKKVRENFVKLSLKVKDSFINDFTWRLGYLFDYLNVGSNLEEIGLTENERHTIFSKLTQGNIHFKFGNLKRKIKRPFLKFLIAAQTDYRSQNFELEWQFYFNSLIIELLDVRNAQVHSGIVNHYSKIKLESLVPLAISRVRWYMINECRKNKEESYDRFIKLILM